MSRIDRCAGCHTIRAKGKHWYYVYLQITQPGRELEPLAKWCPTRAPPDLVEKRDKQKAARVRRAP